MSKKEFITKVQQVWPEATVIFHKNIMGERLGVEITGANGASLTVYHPRPEAEYHVALLSVEHLANERGANDDRQ
jgi:tRNA A58 N-methylase Trm61